MLTDLRWEARLVRHLEQKRLAQQLWSDLLMGFRLETIPDCCLGQTNESRWDSTKELMLELTTEP
jgi:hypothetical protein